MAIEVGVDEKGWVQEAKLIKDQKSFEAFKEQDFKFSVSKLSAATDFQKKIYRELCKLKAGKTLTYKALSEKAGCPKAFRAVGTAMAKNPVVIFVPCHRVVRTDGALGGYSGLGGLKTKKKLLSIETS